MFVQGSIELYVVGGEIDSSVDFSRLVFAVSIDELPDAYANGQILLLSFDFAPLEAWKLYKAVANQSVVFNASEWMEDKINPYVKAIEAANRDGALAEALADGTITITQSPTPPIDPQLYDIWQCPADNVNIGDLSAADAEIMQKNGTNDVYFYWGTDSQWRLTTMPMESSIQDSKSTAIVKSQASVWNTVNVGTEKYINGWQSILEYQNGGVTRNDFAIIADNFYIGAVGNVVQNGVDASGQPIYESTGEAYKAFEVDIVNHKIKMTANVEIDGDLLVDGTVRVEKIDVTTLVAANMNVTGLFYGRTIEGGELKGVNITGAVIKSSWIDYSSTGALTNWKAATDIENPASVYYPHRNNFAKDNTTGLFIKTDGNMYYRLPALLPLYSSPASKTIQQMPNIYGNSFTITFDITSNIYMASSYDIEAAHRVVKATGENVIMSVPNDGLICTVGYGTQTDWWSASCSFKLNGLDYTISGLGAVTCSNGFALAANGGANFAPASSAAFSTDGITFRRDTNIGRVDVYGEEENWIKLYVVQGAYTTTLRDFTNFMDLFSISYGGQYAYNSTTFSRDLNCAIPLFEII